MRRNRLLIAVIGALVLDLLPDVGRGRVAVRPTHRAALRQQWRYVGGPFLAQGWRAYGPGEKYEALRNYERYRKAPKKERKKIQREYERWRDLPVPERARIRNNYERYRRLSPEKRKHFEERFRDWKRKHEAR